jgi:NADPH-dependent 2,4-dienoyl-CoA reductase/sulfur reductase-like enzyme
MDARTIQLLGEIFESAVYVHLSKLSAVICIFYLLSFRMPLGIARCLPRALFRIPSSALPRFVSLRQVSTVTSILPDDIYDVVVVGGGIAGLALATRLRTTPPVQPN